MCFKGRKVFSDLNLSIESSKIVGFVGPNGTGKSVLFKLISGIYRPDKGNIYVRGEKIGEKGADFPTDLGILVDNPGFVGIYTGFKNLKYLAEIQGKIDDEKIISLMEALELSHIDKTLTKNYSLGMKQKMGIIQAIMENQDIIILDEPFNALDKRSVKKVKELIYNLKKEGKTVLLTSPNQADLDEMCDKLYYIYDYKLNETDS